MNVMEKSIEATKKSFEKSFCEEEFYNKQTQDTEHLESILDSVELTEGMKILDLGTGSGYLAFSIARKHKKVTIIGLDIVEQALVKNQEQAKNEQLEHLQFVNYDGNKFPFEDGTFDLVLTRYALHHFPVIEDTFQEISRVLKTSGKLFVSDPTPNHDDATRFVDEYMQMKKDGHIKFYTKDEFIKLGANSGLEFINGFMTSIRFPKKRKDAVEFDKIVSKYDKKIIDGYDIQVSEDEIFITERVNNLIFIK